MFSSKLHATILALAFTIGAGAAHATTITFDELPPSDQIGMPVGTDFATGGYNFNLTGGLAWIMAARADGAYASNGTTSLDLGGMVTVTNIANKAFSLASLDLATFLAVETSTVKLTGTDVSGNNIVQTYTLSGAGGTSPYGLTTYNPSGFDHLTSLVLELVYNQSTATYFSLVDNLVLNEQAVTAVPEPETWAMLGLGLAMVAGLARRKRA